MENKILELLKNKDVKIALIGATNDSTKFGNIIYRDLKRKKYLIYGINPKASTIDGDKAFHTIEDLGFIPDILNFVIPPSLALPLIKTAIDKGYDNFWLQPGAESEEIISLLETSGKNFLAHACVMVETR
jgi:predicted CoA-binding protein